MITATEVLSFLEHRDSCVIERREVHSGAFSLLRRNLRLIVLGLSEDGDDAANEVADAIRSLLSEWLTVPTVFDDSLLESVSLLGDAGVVETKWGHEIRAAYDHACAAARLLRRYENPVRTEIRDAVQHARGLGLAWKIYCHRRARPHFDSIVSLSEFESNPFLHSVKDYREVAPFDVLIKVGPLRSKGWGSAPDAILSAPRFGRMVQVVWSGCADEDGFGYDPAAVVSGIGPTTGPSPSRIHSVRWEREVVQAGDSSGAGTEVADEDELKIFQAIARTPDMRRAILVQIDDEDGILYPPHSQVLAFDSTSSSEESIGYRQPGETLAEGMFLIWPRLGAADLGGLHASAGRYSRIWKERLRQEMVRDPEGLLQRLRKAGVELRNLRSRIWQWCRPPSTVIHAPQQRAHFERLATVLGIDHEPRTLAGTVRHPWWEYAWAEIGNTRGEAIQTGRQEHEIMDEQLFLILRSVLPEIGRRTQNHAVFELEIPQGRDLSGVVRFYRVRSIEGGFFVPENMLKVICDLDSVDQWRI